MTHKMHSLKLGFFFKTNLKIYLSQKCLICIGDLKRSLNFLDIGVEFRIQLFCGGWGWALSATAAAATTTAASTTPTSSSTLSTTTTAAATTATAILWNTPLKLINTKNLNWMEINLRTQISIITSRGWGSWTLLWASAVSLDATLAIRHAHSAASQGSSNVRCRQLDIHGAAVERHTIILLHRLHSIRASFENNISGTWKRKTSQLHKN